MGHILDITKHLHRVWGNPCKSNPLVFLQTKLINSPWSGISKNHNKLKSVQVGFCYQMNYGTKFRKKKRNTSVFKAFGVQECRPLPSLTKKPIP